VEERILNLKLFAPSSVLRQAIKPNNRAPHCLLSEKKAISLIISHQQNCVDTNNELFSARTSFHPASLFTNAAFILAL
jgi:hypothetical protein